MSPKAATLDRRSLNGRRAGILAKDSEDLMGFYIRKRVRVGPLRFNLSKSGVGVSAGFRGFRIGSGPRGNYVHMGQHGLYYRATLPGGPRQYVAEPGAPRPSPSVADESVGLTKIESAEVAQMTDSSAADLLAELNHNRKKARLAPIVAAFGGVVFLVAIGSGHHPWVPAVTLLAVVAFVWLAKVRDDLAKTVVPSYKLEDEAALRYEQLHNGFDTLRSCRGRWRIEAKGATRDQKHHAGATSLVSRKPVVLAKGQPPYVRTNVEVPNIPVGRRTLWLFPDRILVFDVDGVGAVRYQDVHIERTAGRFIEDRAVPADAKVVGRTWRYVNKSGGPDKRFKANRQLPVALYEQIHLTTETGLNELLQVSKLDGGLPFEAAVKGMAEYHPLAKAGGPPI